MLSICVPYTEVVQDRLQWNYVFVNWNIDKFYFYLPTTFPENENWHTGWPLVEKTCVYINSYSDITESLVYITPKTSSTMVGETNIKDFTHPNDCCYVFGDNNSGIRSDLPGNKIYIDTISELFCWQSATITLFDRMCKNAN